MMSFLRKIPVICSILCVFPSLFQPAISTETLGDGNSDINNLPLIKAFHSLETFVSENHQTLHNDVNNADEVDELNKDNIIYAFEENINENSSACVNDTGRLVTGLLNKESWALQFFDATGKPGPSLTQGWLNFVGNYDQCRSAKGPSKPSSSGGRVNEFHGSYFQMKMKSSSLPVSIQIGLCLPDTCSEKQVKSLGTETSAAANASLSIVSVHQLSNATEMTSATIVAIVVTCLIGLMMILGTSFDIVFVQLPLWEEERENRIDETKYPDDLLASSDERKSLLDHDHARKKALCFKAPTNHTCHPNSIATKMLMAFSVYSNSKKILNNSQAAGSLESIHGIRFLSISWVVLAHSYIFANGYTLNMAGAYTEFLNRWTFDVISNGFVSVDTFFTLSGLLTSYLTIGQLLKKGLKINWPLFYFHRFWRLTPPYMLVLLLYLGFQQYFISGPLRNIEQPIDKSNCEKHWWTNLLYINNMYDQDEMCFGHSWYLANDMQFFILSPLMMIPFYFHHLAGLCSCLVFLLATWITTGVLSTVDEWPSTGINLKDSIQGVSNDGWMDDYYIKPWCRMGPFIVGIVAGYILAIHQGRPFYMKWWVVVLGWMTSAVSAVAVLYGLRGDITGDDPSSVGAAALYNSVARSVWGACVGWVIIACAAGYGGPVNVLLSWSPFVVLGRLSYMVYLIHYPIIFIFYQNLDRLFYMNDTTMVVYFLGFLVISNLLAFVFMLGLESPMIGLEKAILKRGK